MLKNETPVILSAISVTQNFEICRKSLCIHVLPLFDWFMLLFTLGPKLISLCSPKVSLIKLNIMNGYYLKEQFKYDREGGGGGRNSNFSAKYFLNH